MGRPPAYIFVVRHGNRLDAANKQWHLQSPTPYDPPLTYSGWNQARATGQRIAQIIRDREAQDEVLATADDGFPRKRRKYQVVIHSSPFLRCVQTSIGISAGIASVPEPRPAAPVRASSTHSVTNPRLRLRTSISVDVPPTAVADLPTPPETDVPKKLNIDKTVLRLDAFLGEWLTPSYFEHVTPPPGSSLMLASAKANLLRKEDYANNPNFAAYNNANASQTMWGSQLPAVATPTTPVSTLDNVSSLAEALRRAGRSDSVTSVTSNGESRLMSGGAYVAPVPTYAISHSAEIPHGYVPHARDNCCDVDYQWDSMRGTLDWGDGGVLGEEWPHMHKRFRKGLQKLIDWYTTAESPHRMVTKERRASVTDDYVMVDDEEDVEVESIVILVSHGAGCNALIGALTHAPVLTDVGLASLTQATRKSTVGQFEDDGLTRYNSNGSSGGSHPTGLVTLHESYSLTLTAVSDHLSTGRPARAASAAATTPPTIPPIVPRARLNSSVFASSPLSGNGLFSAVDKTTENNGNASTAPAKPAAAVPATRDTPTSMWTTNEQRLGLNTGLNGGGITVGSGVTSFLRQTPALWSPFRSSLDTPDEDEDNFLPNFSAFDPPPPPPAAAAPSTISAEPATPKPAGVAVKNRSLGGGGGGVVGGGDDSYVSPRTAVEERERAVLPQLGSGVGGLWGSPRPIIQEDEIPRDLSSPKRRWTVNERW